MNKYLTKMAAIVTDQHDFERAKYKESREWHGIENPVGSIKRDGAAFFMRFNSEGKPQFLSRRPSVRGGYPDRTANLMHLPDVRLPQYAGNAYHVELIHSGPTFHDEILDSHPVVSGILNSKPERALATQAVIGPVRAILLDVMNPKLPTYGEKLVHLQQLHDDFGNVPNLHMPSLKIGKEAIDKLVQDTKDMGHEGIVVTSLTAPEEKNVRLKVKHVDTYNLKVTKVIQEIDIFGNPKESMGALTCEDATGREVCNVGTGFTRDMRKWFWEHRDTVPGMLIQVKAMPTTAHRLRAPVYNGEADGDVDTV